LNVSVCAAMDNHYKLDTPFYFEQAAENDTLVIVAFGNSITATRKTIDQVFAQRLPSLLKNDGIICRVINAGIGGSHTGHRVDNQLFRIPHALDRLDTAVLAKNPQLTIIGFGTNDAYIDSKVKNGPSRIPLQDYQNNLEYIINQLQHIDSRIILIAPNPLGEKFPDFQNKRLTKYVKVVRKLARKYHTGLVDNFKAFKKFDKKKNQKLDDLLLDGIHPNDQGHIMIAEALRQVIVNQHNN
ncbi:MAG: hypothetical protein KDC53_11260, partial [Saprospiraceae bacterium]|nr:hypothetical protein [Saprospiraceae bacterium]